VPAQSKCCRWMVWLVSLTRMSVRGRCRSDSPVTWGGTVNPLPSPTLVPNSLTAAPSFPHCPCVLRGLGALLWIRERGHEITISLSRAFNVAKGYQDHNLFRPISCCDVPEYRRQSLNYLQNKPITAGAAGQHAPWRGVQTKKNLSTRQAGSGVRHDAAGGGGIHPVSFQ